MKYIACQNSVILGIFDSIDEAEACINQEKQRDFLSVVAKKALLKKLQKKGSNIALHDYYILKCAEVLNK